MLSVEIQIAIQSPSIYKWNKVKHGCIVYGKRWIYTTCVIVSIKNLVENPDDIGRLTDGIAERPHTCSYMREDKVIFVRLFIYFHRNSGVDFFLLASSPSAASFYFFFQEVNFNTRLNSFKAGKHSSPKSVKKKKANGL